MIKLFTVILFLGFAFQAFAQEKQLSEKGIYAYWGWNRAWYTKSDIAFKGETYDFTLSDVKAYDRPTAFGLSPYFNPLLITIPQYNFRLGYIINEHFDISICDDHMKYVVQQNQYIPIEGFIEDVHPEFNGTYTKGDEIRFTDAFMNYEHTDGLNYINIELRYRYNLLSFFNNQSKNFKINSVTGVGTGPMLPKTNVRFAGFQRNDEFHLAGFGIGILQGFQAIWKNHFFIITEAKTGYINMPDIRTTRFEVDRAKQSFSFFQWNLSLGYQLNFRAHQKPGV